MKKDQKRPRKRQATRPMLTRADLRRISEQAASYGLTDELVKEIAFAKFGTTQIKYLPSRKVKPLCEAIAAEGERRFELARQREEAKRLEAERAEQLKQAREKRKQVEVQKSRKAWSENSNRARVERRRARRAAKKRGR